MTKSVKINTVTEAYNNQLIENLTPKRFDLLPDLCTLSLRESSTLKRLASSSWKIHSGDERTVVPTLENAAED